MNRRRFLGGVAAALAASCLPKLPPPRRPRPITTEVTITRTAAFPSWFRYVLNFSTPIGWAMPFAFAVHGTNDGAIDAESQVWSVALSDGTPSEVDAG